MKFKQKFIGWLGSAVIATTAISAIASCAFRRHPAGQYEVPTITFAGSSTTIDNGEEQTNGTLPFTFDREIYDGEKVSVELSPVDGENITLTPTIHYKAGSDVMTVDINADISSIYETSEQKFKLRFSFEFDGVTYGGDEDYPDTFTFVYTAPWEQNDIKCNYTGPYTTDLESEKTFISEDFELDRALKETDPYNETLSVVSLNSNIEIQEVKVDETTKTKLTITFAVVDCDDYEDSSEDFDIEFRFGYRDNPNRFIRKASQKLDDNLLTVNYNRAWEPNQLHFVNDANNRIFTTSPGQTSVSSDANEFYLDRNLKDSTAPIDYNEKLNFDITDANFDEAPGYTKDDLKLEKIVSNTSVNVSLTLDVKGGDKYKELKVTNIVIHWSILDEKFDVEGEQNSGNFTKITYEYQPAIKENSVIVEGYNAGINDLVPETDGTNGVNIISYNGTDPKAADDNFHFARLLDDEVTVTVEPEYVGTKNYDISLSTLSYTYFTDADENKTQYINFSAEFSEMPSEDISQQFKLKFTFTKNGESLPPQVLDKVFNLKYVQPTGPVPETNHGPRLASQYKGVNHGDVIFHVQGSLTKPLVETQNGLEPYEITIADDQKGKIEFLKGDGEYSDGYQILKNETTGKYDVVDMYVRIVDPALKHYEGQIYSTTFKFNFNHAANYEEAKTNIVYEEYSNQTDVYIRSRTIPISIKYRASESSFQREFGTTWVLAKAPELNPQTGQEEILDNGYCYYVATTREFKNTYDSWVQQYSSKDDFTFGITDYTFAQPYKYYQNDVKGNPIIEGQWTASDYRYNYVYCDTSKLEWVKDNGQFNYNDTYGADIFVAKVDFKKLMFVEGEEQIDNDMIIAYLNKLNTLNNFYVDHGQVNDFVTADLDTLDKRNQYSEFVVGGYPWIQHRIPDEGFDGWTMSRTHYQTYSYTPSQLSYVSATDYRKGEHLDEISGSNLTHGAPVYKVNTKQSRPYEAVDSGDGYGLSSMFGGMLACKSKTYDSKFGMYPIKMAGIFRNERVWNKHTFIITWWTEDDESYYPCFDIVRSSSAGDMLKQYTELGK